MKKFTLLLSAFLPVVASLAIQVAASLIVTFWFSVFATAGLLLEGISEPDQMISGMLTLLTDPLFNDILLGVTYIALSVVFLIWYRKQKDNAVPASFDEVFCIRNLAIYLTAGLAAQVAVSMCLNLVLPIFPQTYERYMLLLESLVGGNIIVAVVATVVMAPIAEEIIFRELMSKKLQKLFPFWFANIIQALTFGIYHMNIVQAVYAFFLGLLFGYIAHRMRSVWASVMFHGMVNASGLVLDIILPDALMESTSGMIIFAVLCGTITLLLTMLYRFPQDYTTATAASLPEGTVTDILPDTSESGAPEAGTSEAGTSEAGTSEAGASDAVSELSDADSV